MHQQTDGKAVGTTKMRSTIGLLVLFNLIAVGILSGQGPKPLPAASDTALADLVFLTDDRNNSRPGCEAISVFDSHSGADIARGAYHASPGRLAATPDGTLAVAMSANSGPFVYFLARSSDSNGVWRTFRVNFSLALENGQPAISHDGKWLLLPMSSGSLHVYRIADIRRAIDTGRLSSLGRPVATFSGPIAATIVVAPTASIAYLVGTDGFIYPLALPDLMLQGSPIPFQGVIGAAFVRTLRTYAALSPDGRYLVINTANRGEVALVNLATGTSKVVTTPGLTESHGLAFNAVGASRGKLAIHGHHRVAVFDLTPDEQLVLQASVAVPPQGWEEEEVPEVIWWRSASIAWTGRGDGIIAAIDSGKEFRVFDYDLSVTDGAASLKLRFDLNSCALADDLNLGLDVITLNDRLPTPTATELPTSTDIPPTPPPPTTATPVSTTSPTAIATLTPPPTPTPPPTLTPLPTATPTPAPLYLPLTLRETCIPDQRRIDVILVIDASSSMQDPTSTGRPKIAAALDAARTFLDQLQPDRGDQAAIVAFNADATLLQPLTTDRAALASALARIQIAPQTCLVCGVETADAELAGPRHRPDHAATMIVLTDGRSNPHPASEAVDRAAAAKARGVVVFTIGLGDDLDAEALRDMASRPEFAYRAPDAEDLADIYRAIAVAIPCPAGAFWGGR